MDASERIAQAFHETYERLAPDHGYRTREASAKPWADVPEQNRNLMIATVGELLNREVIREGIPPAVEELRAGSRWQPLGPDGRPADPQAPDVEPAE